MKLGNLATLDAYNCHYDLKIETNYIPFRTKFLYSICHNYIFDDRSENQSKDKHSYFFILFILNVFELLF